MLSKWTVINKRSQNQDPTDRGHDDPHNSIKFGSLRNRAISFSTRFAKSTLEGEKEEKSCHCTYI